MPVTRRVKRQPRKSVVAEQPSSTMEPSPAGLSGKLSGLLGQIGSLRDQAVGKIRELEQALTAARKELATIDGLMGRKTASPSAVREGAGTRAKSGSRMPRGYWRSKVLSALDEKPDGMNKSELLAALHAKGDAKQEASVSNTLMSLKKASEIKHENGRYAKMA